MTGEEKTALALHSEVLDQLGLLARRVAEDLQAVKHNIGVGSPRATICEQISLVLSNADAVASHLSAMAAALGMIAGIKETAH